MSRRNTSLFSDLPAPAVQPAQEPAAEDSLHERPDKRAKLEHNPDLSKPEPAHQEHAPDEVPRSASPADQQHEAAPSEHPGPASQPQQQPGDQVKAALTKIASHISNPSKFQKASGLLRQLLDSGALTKEHRQQLFDTVRAAFKHPEHCTKPTLRKEYMRLMQAIERRDELFRNAERQQLEVYAIYAQLQNELHTDDSFVFNRVLRKVQELLSQLPEASEEDEEAYQQLQDPEAAVAAQQEAARQALEQQEAAARAQEAAEAAAAAAPAADPELDPFGLDSLLDKPKPKPKPAKKPAAAQVVSTAWTPAQLMVMRRQALLECLETARGCYKLPWAATSIELAIENVHKQKQQLCSQQHKQLEEMYRSAAGCCCLLLWC
jgi:hypothetical protein